MPLVVNGSEWACCVIDDNGFRCVYFDVVFGVEHLWAIEKLRPWLDKATAWIEDGKHFSDRDLRSAKSAARKQAVSDGVA